jgi:hypothetical protein
MSPCCVSSSRFFAGMTLMGVSSGDGRPSRDLQFGSWLEARAEKGKSRSSVGVHVFCGQRVADPITKGRGRWAARTDCRCQTYGPDPQPDKVIRTCIAAVMRSAPFGHKCAPASWALTAERHTQQWKIHVRPSATENTVAIWAGCVAMVRRAKCRGAGSHRKTSAGSGSLS